MKLSLLEWESMKAVLSAIGSGAMNAEEPAGTGLQTSSTGTWAITKAGLSADNVAPRRVEPMTGMHHAVTSSAHALCVSMKISSLGSSTTTHPRVPSAIAANGAAILARYSLVGDDAIPEPGWRDASVLSASTDRDERYRQARPKHVLGYGTGKRLPRR